MAGAGFHKRSRSTAAHIGRRGDGAGVRLLGYLFVEPEDFVRGRGAFHRLAIRVGDWLPDGCGIWVLPLVGVSSSSLRLG